MTERIHLLLIDPQNDFCDTPNFQPELVPAGERPALAVPGSHQDMLRVSNLVKQVGERIERIFVTMDSHPFVAIERTTFWRDADGNEVAPSTKVTAQSVREGRFVPVQAERVDPISGKRLHERVVELLERLEAAGHYTLMVWPVHCVKGTWGASLHPAIASCLNEWERQSAYSVAKVDKGEYPLVEHYGVFEAETPLEEVSSTCFNTDLADLLDANITLIAGEASSHCVAASYDQLVRQRGSGRGIVVLTDAMSPVTGFEQAQADFFERARKAGSMLATVEETIDCLRPIQ